MMGEVLNSWYCFTNESGCMILSNKERKTVKVFISSTQPFCFSSLLRHNVKLVKWRLTCITHFLCCSLRSSAPLLQYSELFRRRFGTDPPTDKSVRRWYNSLKQPDIYVKGRVQDVRECQTKESRMSEQLNEFEPQDFIWQKDIAPPGFLHNTRDGSKVVVPRRWIGRPSHGFRLMASTVSRSHTI